MLRNVILRYTTQRYVLFVTQVYVSQCHLLCVTPCYLLYAQLYLPHITHCYTLSVMQRYCLYVTQCCLRYTTQRYAHYVTQFCYALRFTLYHATLCSFRHAGLFFAMSLLYVTQCYVLHAQLYLLHVTHCYALYDMQRACL